MFLKLGYAVIRDQKRQKNSRRTYTDPRKTTKEAAAEYKEKLENLDS